MERQYHDMYALFRHEPGAEQFYHTLPSYVQDQLSAHYKLVDSLERLHSYAAGISQTDSQKMDGPAVLPPPITI